VEGSSATARSARAAVTRIGSPILGLLGILAMLAPVSLWILISQIVDHGAAPPLLATIRTVWTGLLVLLLVVGAILGVLAYAGPDWRRWVRMDQADERAAGGRRVASMTTGYRLRQIAASLLAGVLMVGWLVWQLGPLIAEIGAVAAVAIGVGIAFLHIGSIFIGIAAYGYAMNPQPLLAVQRLSFGVVVVAAGVVFGWTGAVGRLDWLKTFQPPW
jgi:hypothetical protein